MDAYNHMLTSHMRMAPDAAWPPARPLARPLVLTPSLMPSVQKCRTPAAPSVFMHLSMDFRWGAWGR